MAVTNPTTMRGSNSIVSWPISKQGLFCLQIVLLLTGSAGLRATVLPEDRADIMYHRYDGGGVEVDGPSILVRKSFSGNV
ncbi:MAG: hypothetical protein AB2765_14945, partial [Candidatus Thiodiazotropha endolucinida]